MELDKTTFNIKVVFEDAKIKDHTDTKSSPKIQKIQGIDPIANGKVQLIEDFSVVECLNYKTIGRYKPIMLQRLLKNIQQQTLMSFSRHKISIYLSKPQLHMNCGNYPIPDSVLIRGKDYIQENQLTIVARKRGEIDPELQFEQKVEKNRKKGKIDSETVSQDQVHMKAAQRKLYLQTVNTGMTIFESVLFNDYQSVYDQKQQYKKQVQRHSNLTHLKQLERERIALEEKIKYISRQRKQKLKAEEELNRDLEASGIKVERKDKKQKIKSQVPGRRDHERRIGEVIDKVVEWTRWTKEHRDGWLALKAIDQKQYEPALSLEEAALVVNVPKKTLDNYLFHLQYGCLNRFNFNEHATDSFAVIRMFVNNYNKESKINPLIYKKVNEFNERKKLVKRQKLEKKKLEKTKLQ